MKSSLLLLSLLFTTFTERLQSVRSIEEETQAHIVQALSTEADGHLAKAADANDFEDVEEQGVEDLDEEEDFANDEEAFKNFDREAFDAWHKENLEVATQGFDASTFADKLKKFIDAPAGECGSTSGKGIDLRACWGKLIDLEDNEVCGKDVMNSLLQEAEGLKAGSHAGASGSTIVFTTNFVVKSVEKKERDVLSKFASYLDRESKRQKGCYSTALTPHCGLISDAQGDWLLIRKVEIPKSQMGKFGLSKKQRGMRLQPTQDFYPGYKVKFFDLKGPFYAKYDFKARMSSEKLVTEKKTLKDLGFQKYFQKGQMQLADAKGCHGSVDAAHSYSKSSTFLQDFGITDYSFFANLYTVGNHTKPYCPCSAGDSRPRFPILLSSADGTLMATGIIDMLVDNYKKWYDPRRLGTTQDPPDKYRSHFAKMWQGYFRLPPQKQKKGRGASWKDARGEGVKVGDMVEALVNMKWKKAGWFAKEYAEMITDIMKTGSGAKIDAGELGRIVPHSKTNSTSAWVKWSSRKGKVFAVPPELLLKSNGQVGR